MIAEKTFPDNIFSDCFRFHETGFHRIEQDCAFSFDRLFRKFRTAEHGSDQLHGNSKFFRRTSHSDGQGGKLCFDIQVHRMKFQLAVEFGFSIFPAAAGKGFRQQMGQPCLFGSFIEDTARHYHGKVHQGQRMVFLHQKFLTAFHLSKKWNGRFDGILRFFLPSEGSGGILFDHRGGGRGKIFFADADQIFSGQCFQRRQIVVDRRR